MKIAFLLASGFVLTLTCLGTGCSSSSGGGSNDAGPFDASDNCVSLGGCDGGAINDGGTATDAGGGNDGSVATDGGSSMDAGGGNDAGASSDGGAMCNNVAALGTPVDVTQMAADPPAATGGTITPGTYVMTSSVEYTGPGGGTGPTGNITQQTLVITKSTATSGTAQVVDISYNGDSAQVNRSTVTFTTSGSTLSFTGACGMSGTGMTAYTVTGNTFIFYEPGNNNRVDTFARQ